MLMDKKTGCPCFPIEYIFTIIFCFDTELQIGILTLSARYDSNVYRIQIATMTWADCKDKHHGGKYGD